MSLSKSTKDKICESLVTTVTRKLEDYDPETDHMPFHYRLLGKDRYAMFSFIHSMNTTFGMSIWEQIAVLIAQDAGYIAERQYKLLGEIDKNTEDLITNIHYKLRKGTLQANKNFEIHLIRNSIQPGMAKPDPDSTVDLFIKINSEENYIDITSVKPNIKEFAALKLKLLKWTALRLSQDKSANVFTRLAIPYNPYHPEPYERWTLQGLYDLGNKEILIGADFWNFLANENIYDELLNIFELAGKILRPKINTKFKKFKYLY